MKKGDQVWTYTVKVRPVILAEDPDPESTWLSIIAGVDMVNTVAKERTFETQSEAEGALALRNVMDL